MADWYARAVELKSANPEMTAAQIGAALGKSASSVRSAIKRMRDQEGVATDETDATENVATVRNVTPGHAGRPRLQIDVERIDMTSLIKAARDTAIESMTNENVPWNIRAGTAVQIINGPHGKALAEQAAMDAPKDEREALPEHVEEIIVALRRRVTD